MTKWYAWLKLIAACLWIILALVAAVEITGPSGGASTLQQAFDGGDGSYGDCTAVKPCRFLGNSGAETFDIYWDMTDGWKIVSSTGGGVFQGYAATTNTKSAAYTIGTDDPAESYGGVIYVDTAAVITAEAVAAGMNFRVITTAAVAVSVDVNASDRMILDGTALDDGDKATNTSTAGDEIVCTYESAAGLYCSSTGWTDDGA